MTHRRRLLLLGVVLLLAGLTAGLLLDAGGRAVGWARGEPAAGGRSAHVWRAGLHDPDPTRRAATADELVAAGPDAGPVLIRLLADPEPEVRLAAIDLTVRTKTVADSLAPLVRDPDPLVRVAACRAAGELTLPAALPVLAEALPLPDAARALRKYGLGARAAVPRLIECLDDPNPEVRREAAKTLGKAGEVSAVEPLIRKFTDPDPVVREWAAEACGEFGPRAVAAVPGLTRLLTDEAVKVRRDAVRSLGQIGPPAAGAAAAIEKLVFDPEEIVRKAAAEALKRVRG